MAKAKMIKEVEVKFSPAFEKAINGVKTKKKAATKTAKTKTKKVVTKTKTKATKTRKAKVTKPAAPKAKRGYTIVRVERELTINQVKDVYELYELTGKGIEQPKYFVTEEHAKRYIETLKSEDLQSKALAGKVHGGPMARAVVSEMKELAAQADLPELDTDRPERCDKTSIEDIDA
jgi:hypothetical protein